MDRLLLTKYIFAIECTDSSWENRGIDTQAGPAEMSILPGPVWMTL